MTDLVSNPNNQSTSNTPPRQPGRPFPWSDRSRQWWDKVAIVGSILIAVVWFLYTFVRTMDSLFLFTLAYINVDLLSPLLMIAIPFIIVTFRTRVDRLLFPLRSLRKKISRPFLIGIGIAVPFLTAFVLTVFGIDGYLLMQCNLVVGIFVSYIIIRNPVPVKGIQQPDKPNIKVPAFIFFLCWVCIGCVTAHDCMLDPFNAEDCLMTSGFAEFIAGLFAALLSLLVNGFDIFNKSSGDDIPYLPP
ncbi:MAG: hypothetical protein LUO98_01990 [Methanoregula sp.]|nr:hypothetical protein [Methanoregula sp.]